MLTKFGVPNPPEHPVSFAYEDVFELETNAKFERLVIGPAANQASLLLELAATWESKRYGLLYLLVVARGEHPEGRYQCPEVLGTVELRTFLQRYGTFLEQDGRHSLWIVSPVGEGTLIYDQHNVIFGYGPLARYRRVLAHRKFTEAAIPFPEPHVHWYHNEFDQTENQLFAEFEWLRFPLQENDYY
jgi:hypothetical protein